MGKHAQASARCICGEDIPFLHFAFDCVGCCLKHQPQRQQICASTTADMAGNECAVDTCQASSDVRAVLRSLATSSECAPRGVQKTWAALLDGGGLPTHLATDRQLSGSSLIDLFAICIHPCRVQQTAGLDGSRGPTHLATGRQLSGKALLNLLNCLYTHLKD